VQQGQQGGTISKKFERGAGFKETLSKEIAVYKIYQVYAHRSSRFHARHTDRFEVARFIDYLA
jgi:hypothetical protein